MAIGMDPSLLRKMGLHPNVFWKRQLFQPRRAFRYFLRRLLRDPTYEISAPMKWNGFMHLSEQFQSTGFAYFENFLDQESMELLTTNWPKLRYFRPISRDEKTKTSDRGFQCTFQQPDFTSRQSPAIAKVYEMFSSREFANDVQGLCGDGIEREAYHLLAQYSSWGSGLAPHRDSENVGLSAKVNFIFFVAGNGSGLDCGGTSILKDNSFDHPIFTPQNLNNAILFYRSETELFHGFPCLKFRKKRKVIIAHFSNKKI